MDGGLDFSKLPSWMRKASGYNCTAPVNYEYESEMFTRYCGHCARCVARKKRDVAGRCAAEAYTAAEVVVWTLTYGTLEPFPRDGRPWVQDVSDDAVLGAADFITKHRQDFLKRVRQALFRKARRQVGAPKVIPTCRPRIDKWGEVHAPQQAMHVRAYWLHKIAQVMPVIKLMGCGERGSKRTKRCHWHVVLFMSKVSGFISTPPDPKTGKPGRENHDLWPHGYVNIDVLDRDIEPKMKAVRYAVKYLSKSKAPSRAGKLRGEKPEAKFFRSLSRPLGWQYITDLARDYARQGVPIHGQYQVPGVRFSKRPFALVKHTVLGRMRDHYIEAFRDEWEKLRPHVAIPRTEFMMRHDPDDCFDTDRGYHEKPKKRDAVPPPPPVTIAKRDRSGLKPIFVRGVFAGMVQLLYSGFCQFQAPDGTLHPVPHGNVRDLVNMDHASHCHVEAWIAETRGSDWVEYRERRLRKAQRHISRVDATRQWAKRAPSVEPPHVRDAKQPITGVYRKLMINGNGHVPGTVVYDPDSKPDPETGKKLGFIRPVTVLKKPIRMRYV